MSSANLAPYIRRLLLVLVISTVAVFLVSEIGIRLQHENSARAPQTVELTIPAGTAAKVEAGIEPPDIPSEMVFVLGDVLLVNNMDSVGHSLGLLFIPPGASASMPLDQADNLALSCSFTKSQYLGLDVKPPTTLSTRLVALAFTVPSTAAMFYLYSFLAFPPKVPAESQQGKEEIAPKE